MDQKDEVKSKVDIVEVVSSYLPLKKMGRNFGGLCPFHTEKTASFMVSPERQVFKCFGCGEAGDVFTFLEKIEGWDFRETLEELAGRVGVKLVKYAPSGQAKAKEKLVEIHRLAAKFYAHLLNKHPIGEVARRYLATRGVRRVLWEKFGLGYAPSTWEKTLDFLKSRGFGVEDVAQAGLVIPGKGGYYDRFRNRLMFPLKDSRGTILGFAGRVISEGSRVQGLASSGEASRPEAKYINSPETPIFNKGRLLFGLDIARSAIRDRSEVVLVEGEFDVLSSFQAGVENVVASKGTALTSHQVVLLSRICESVALCFDRDVAGDSASRRGIELLDAAGLEVKVVGLSKYKDPDEFTKNDGPGFKKAIAEAVNIYDYLIDSAVSRIDPKTSGGKKKIGAEVIPVLAKITDDLVRAHYIDKLAKVLELDVALVNQAVEKKVARVFAPGSDINPEDSQKTPAIVEKYFLALYLFQDEVSHQVLKSLSPEDFKDSQAASFWEWLRDIIGTPKTVSLKKVMGKLPTEFSKFVDELYLINISPIFSDRELWANEIVKIAGRVKQAAIKNKLAQISEEIKQAEAQSDSKQLIILTKKFDVMSKNLKEVSL